LANGSLPILVQLLFRHANGAELVLQQADFPLLTVERPAKVTWKRGEWEQIAGVGSRRFYLWFLNMLQLFSLIKLVTRGLALKFDTF